MLPMCRSRTYCEGVRIGDGSYYSLRISKDSWREGRTNKSDRSQSDAVYVQTTRIDSILGDTDFQSVVCALFGGRHNSRRRPFFYIPHPV